VYCSAPPTSNHKRATKDLQRLPRKSPNVAESVVPPFEPFPFHRHLLIFLTVSSFVNADTAMSLPLSFTLHPPPQRRPRQDDGPQPRPSVNFSRLVSFVGGPRDEPEHNNQQQHGWQVVPAAAGQATPLWGLPSHTTHLTITKHKHNKQRERDAHKPPRRCIRVSPFQPMVHQRKMPKHGTISPLNVRDYYEEKSRAVDTAASHISMRPPLREVRILAQSASSASCSSPDSTSSSEATNAKDYKRLYTQSQWELDELRRVYANSLHENRRLQAAVKLFAKRCRTEARQGRSPPAHAAPNMVPLLSPSPHASGGASLTPRGAHLLPSQAHRSAPTADM
jgi:hypothetical protein